MSYPLGGPFALITSFIKRCKDWVAKNSLEVALRASNFNTLKKITSSNNNIEVIENYGISLEEAFQHWWESDWSKLKIIDQCDIENNTDRAIISLLISVAHQAHKDEDQAHKFINLAMLWGCSNDLMMRILVCGAHNNIGRAAGIAMETDRQKIHKYEALSLSTINNDLLNIVKKMN